ncbi:19734_t:CDS:2, partial [Gigaspora margarita]
DLWAQTTQEDYVYVKCAVGLLNELRILWRNEKHPDNIMEKKDPCENHITITQTGRIIEELFFNLEVPYIST